MATPKSTALAIGVVALFLASIAAYLVYNYLSTKEQEATKAKMEVQHVVVAAKDIPFGKRIQPEDLKPVDWPKTNVPAGSASDPKALNDRLAVADIPAGAPVIESSLAPVTAQAGVLSYIIPPGHRAITVAVNEVVGVAGFVLPNSIVDVVATVPNPRGGPNSDRLSKIVLQNVKVLAVGQILEQKEGKPVSVPTVTLDVMPVDAEKLAIASENKVQLILRHLGDTEEVKTRGATVSTLLGGAMPAAAGPAKAGGKTASRRSATRAVKAQDVQVQIEVIKGNTRTKEIFK